MQTSNHHKFSFLHRFLHWSIAISILFILLTVFLRMDWMNKTNISEIILKDLSAKNISLSQDEAVTIAKHIRKPMWNWHIYIGYTLVGLYIIRLIYILIKGIKSRNIFSDEVKTFKKKLQTSIYILFYLFLGITLLTGVLLEVGPKEYKESLEGIHKLSLFFMLSFIFLHLGGIFLGEKTTEKGVVSAMINGGDK